MEVDKVKAVANQYKKPLEKVNVWPFYYEKDTKKFWCANYKKFNKNTGVYIYSVGNPNQDELLNAYKKMTLSTSLANVTSQNMFNHYSKKLVYFVNLRHLLEEWRQEVPVEANLFNSQIDKYLAVVHYYEQTQQEIHALHVKLNEEVDRIQKIGKLTDLDAEIIMKLSAKFSYLLYCQLCHQKDSIQWIRAIDIWLKQNKRQCKFGRKKLLMKYTDYYINEKSVSYLLNSLKDFREYENDPPIYLMEREIGEAVHLELYRDKQSVIFEKEIIPILRMD